MRTDRVDFALGEGKEGIDAGVFAVCKMAGWVFYINYLV